MPALGDQHKNAPTNPFEEVKPRISEYTAHDLAVLQNRLGRLLGPEYISTRKGPGGRPVHYIASDKVIGLANEVFGFNGWSSAIRDVQVDFVDENVQTRKVDIGLSIIVRVTLRDGTYHEDIGYGHIENCAGKAAAFEKAKKEATTDALKRALRNFGNVLGNCVYDKDYLSKVTKIRVRQRRFTVDNLYRHPDFVAPEQEGGNGSVDTNQESSHTVTKTPPERKDQQDGSSNKTEEDEFASVDFDEADFSFSELDHPDVMSIENKIPITKEQSNPNQQIQPHASINKPQSLPPHRQGQPPNPPSNPPSARPVPNGQTLQQNQQHQQSYNRQSVPPSNAAPARSNSVRTGPTAPAQQNLPRPGPPNAANDVQVPPNRMNNPSTTQAQGQPSRPSVAPPGPPGVPAEQPVPAGAPKGFVQGRNANAAQAATAPIPPFNPQAESPSIRRTPGFDHTKTAGVMRAQVPWNSTASNQVPNQGAAQPEPARRVGAPQAHNSPLANRGQFKPVGKRPAESAGPPVPPQGGHQNVASRQTLADVTAGTVNRPAPVAQDGPPDAKRPRLSSENENSATPGRVST